MNEQDNKAVSGDETRVENKHVPALEQRHFMIFGAAHYRAECRGFQDGVPVADWPEAESEIGGFLENRERSLIKMLAKNCLMTFRADSNDIRTNRTQGIQDIDDSEYTRQQGKSHRACPKNNPAITMLVCKRYFIQPRRQGRSITADD